MTDRTDLISALMDLHRDLRRLGERRRDSISPETEHHLRVAEQALYLASQQAVKEQFHLLKEQEP